MLFTVLATALSCGEREEIAEPVRPIEAVRVGEPTALRGTQFPGTAEALQFADLSFRVEGTVEAVRARLGTRVEKGEVVAQLVQRDFIVRVRAAEAAVAQARATMAEAQEEHARILEMVERDAATEIERIRSQAGKEVARASMEAAEAELESARDDLEDTQLLAPFAGEVSVRYVEAFEDVQARQRVVRLIDDSRIRLRVFVSERLMTQLPRVEEVRCEFDELPGRELIAEIDEVGREADQITRSFPITLVVDQPEDARLLPGMTGRAWVERMRMPPEGIDAFDVPPSAVGEDENGARFVWVFDEADGVVTRREVQVERLSPAGARVRGLDRGEVVATAGAAFLREGQRVRLRTPLPDAALTPEYPAQTEQVPE